MASRSSSGTAVVTRPTRAACTPSKVSPVRNSSAAARGASRGSTVAEITAGITPSRTSVKANVAAVEQTAMSAAAIRPSPPARAAPPTRATTGFGHSQTAASTSPIRAAGMSPAASAAAVSFRSAPEQNTRAGVAQHDHPYRVVGGGGRERVEQLGDQRGGEGVAVVRAVQGQRRHTRCDVGPDHGVGHGRTLRHAASRRADW